VKLRPTDRRILWDELVRSSAGGLQFHEWAWLDLQEQVLGGTIDRLLVYLDGRPVGVLPVPRQAPTSWTRLSIPFPFLGPLVPADLLQATLEAFRRHQLRCGPAVSHMDLGPFISQGGVAAATAAGCRAWNESTVTIDLSHGSVDQLEANFSKWRRRGIRRAARDGGSVRVAEPGELTRLLPRILDEAYAAHDTDNPYPEQLGHLVEEWASGRDDIAAFTALVNGEPAGMHVVLGSGETALCCFGATWRRFRGVDVSGLLYQRCMAWSIERGCSTLDLCGSVDEGVREYKMSFGGVEQNYLVIESSPLPAVAVGVARSLRKRISRGSPGPSIAAAATARL